MHPSFQVDSRRTHQGVPERAHCVVRHGRAPCLERELDAPVRIAGIQEEQSPDRLLSRARLVALCLSIVALGPGEGTQSDGYEEKSKGGDAEAHGEPRTLAAPLLLDLLALPCLVLPPVALLVLTPPLDHGAGEHVVPDLEPGRLFPWRGVDRAEDPPLVELLENRLGDLQRHACVAGEVVGLVDDPRPRRRDQLVQHSRRDLALLAPRALIASSRCLRTIRSAPAQALERLEPEHVRCRRCSSAQSRDMTSCRNGVSTRVCSALLGLVMLDDAASGLAEDDVPGPHLAGSPP